MRPPGKVANQEPRFSSRDLALVREKQIAGRIEELESHKTRFLDEEVINLDL